MSDLTITCPDCQSQFRAPAAAIPDGGRMLRCSACGHRWLYVDPTRVTLFEDMARDPLSSFPPADGPTAPSFLQQHVADDSFARVLSETSKSGFSTPQPKIPGKKSKFLHFDMSGAVGYASAALVGVGLFWFLGQSQYTVTTLLPRAQAAYDVMGMPLVLRSSDLAIEGATITIKDGKVSIKGAVHNLSETQKMMLPVRAALHGKTRPEPLTVWVFRPETKYINPDQKVPFDVTRPFDQSAQVTRVEMTFMTE
jgi:predicted Zn finger-like uncharacterized protein